MKLGPALLVLLASVGCHANANTESAANDPQAASGNERVAQDVAQGDAACCSRCPLALPGTSLKFAQATGGGSMVFTAPDTELAELRERVRELAAYHSRENSRLAMMTLPHQAEAVEIDGGAQLLLTTRVNNDIPTLQQEIEKEVQWMQGGRCPSGDQPACQCQLGDQTPLSSAEGSETTPPPSTEQQQPR
jgi:hypothetical protein